MRSERLSWILPLCGVLQVTAAAVGAWFVVPRFEEAYQAFGGDLPLATRLLVWSYRWWWLGIALPAVVWLLWPRSSRGVAALLASTLLFLLLCLGGIWACYLPYFHLAEVVG
jgi:type II secretory pathway component PulF